MSHGIVHFEIPAEDIQRAKRFYGDMFGWTFTDQGEYTLIDTGEGQVGGGMMQRMAPGQVITDYIAVDDVDAAIVMAESLGGAVVVPKMEVPGVGWFAHLTDTEGNAFAVMQMGDSA